MSRKEMWVTHGAHGLKVGGSLVLEVVGVGNLLRLPDALVGRIVYVLRTPLALVFRVLLHGWFPFAAARSFLAFGVGYSRWDPVTVFLIIPILWLLSLWVGNHCGLVVQPVIGLGGFLINNLVRGVLIPVLWLCSLRVCDTGFVNPTVRLAILGVIDFLLRVDGGREVFQKATSLHLFTIDVDGECLIGVNGQGIE